MAATITDWGNAPSSLAQLTASWLERFYPGVEVTLGQKAVTLRSNAHDAAQLERIWHAALLNEQQLEAASDQRRAMLQELLQ